MEILKQNYLSSCILELFERIEIYQGYLYHITGDLQKYAISIASHSIIHSNAIINIDYYNQMNKEEHKILGSFFSIENEPDSNKSIKFSIKQASELLK